MGFNDPCILSSSSPSHDSVCIVVLSRIFFIDSILILDTLFSLVFPFNFTMYGFLQTGHVQIL